MSRLLLPFADQHVEIPSVSAGNIALTVGLKQVRVPFLSLQAPSFIMLTTDNGKITSSSTISYKIIKPMSRHILLFLSFVFLFCW